MSWRAAEIQRALNDAVIFADLIVKLDANAGLSVLLVQPNKSDCPRGRVPKKCNERCNERCILRASAYAFQGRVVRMIH